jgi:hypothetical protein
MSVYPATRGVTQETNALVSLTTQDRIGECDAHGGNPHSLCVEHIIQQRILLPALIARQNDPRNSRSGIPFVRVISWIVPACAERKRQAKSRAAPPEGSLD